MNPCLLHLNHHNSLTFLNANGKKKKEKFSSGTFKFCSLEQKKALDVLSLGQLKREHIPWLNQSPLKSEPFSYQRGLEQIHAEKLFYFVLNLLAQQTGKKASLKKVLKRLFSFRSLLLSSYLSSLSQI